MSQYDAVAQRKTLTLAQIEVLRWVGDGCPEDGTDGVGRRISVAALRKRALVKTKGSGDSWSATITAEGRDYLDAVEGDAPPTPRAAESVTERLIADILVAGGTLRVPSRGYGQKGVVDYEQRAQAAVRYGRVPDGKRLVVRRVECGQLELSLLDAPEGVVGLAPGEVPDRVGRYHAAGRTTRDSYDRLGLSRRSSLRAARIVHALASAAEEHGFTITAPAVLEPRSLRERSNHPGAFVFCKRNCDLHLRINEAKDGSGRLTIEFPQWGPSMGRPSTWGDRRSWRLEDKLTEVLRELLMRVAEHEDREAEKQREAEQRQAAWEEAMAIARQHHAEAHRAEVLRSEVDGWETADRIREYAAAIEKRFPDDPDAVAWATWAVDHADTLDPLSKPVRVPPGPEEPSAEELRPFLRGWSPYGPNRR